MNDNPENVNTTEPAVPVVESTDTPEVNEEASPSIAPSVVTDEDAAHAAEVAANMAANGLTAAE